MIPRAAIAFCALILSSIAQAETITVRSGEHEGFSRIVVDLPEPTTWTMEQNDLGYQLDLERPDSRFVLDSIFQRVPRTRVIGVRQLEGRSSLIFRVAEQIEAKAFTLDGGAIVVDFSDAPLPESRPVAELPPTQSENRTRTPITLNDQYLSLFWKGAAVDGTGMSEEVPPELMLRAQFDEPDTRVSDAEQSILESLSRAASQGLISIDSEAPDIKEIKSRSSNVRTHEPEPEPSVVPPPSSDHLAFHSQTAIDRELVTHLEQNAFGGRAAACLPDSSFDLGAWLTDEPPGTQIGSARQQLLGEFDKPYPEAVLRLARIYTALGFGAELRALLDAYELEPELEFPLQLISKVVDGGPFLPSPRYLELAQCDGNISLWAFLAADPSNLEQSNFSAIQRTFSALPVHIRTLVGPRLVERLIAVGAGDVARSVRDALTRTGKGEGSSIDMMEARLSLADGDTQKAETHLLKTVQADDGASPEALIILIEETLRKQQPVALALSQNAQALAFELGDTATGVQLRRAAVLGFASVGEFEQAFSYIKEWNSAPQSTLFQETVNDLFGLVSRLDRDDLFWKVYFQNMAIDGANALPDELRLALAGRLVDAGFSRSARDLLAGVAPNTDAKRVLLAKAALAEHDAPAALSHIGDLSGIEAEALRGQAYMMLGRYADAEDSFGRAGQDDMALDAAWLSGNWDRVVADGSEMQRAFIEKYPRQEVYAQSRPNEPDGLLSKSRNLLSDSQEARKALDALLGADI